MLYIKLVPNERKEEAEREIRALKALDHPAFPRLYKAECRPDGIALYMTRFYGKTLGKKVREGKCFTPAEVAIIGAELCSILGHMHGLTPRVLHLDLHPDNIIMTNGHLRIVDFGNSWCGNDASEMPKGRGTPPFSAPELFTGGLLDERTDIFSVGKILLYLLESNAGKEKDTAGALIERAALSCIRHKPEFRIRQAEELSLILRSLL